MRVLHMIGAGKPGGAEMFAYRLLVALNARADVQLMVAARHGWLERMLKESGVDVRTVPYGGMFDFRSRWMLKRLAREFKPQVIQSWMNRATRFMPQGPWATVARLGGFYDLKYYRGRVRELIGNTPMIVDYCVRHGWPRERTAMISNFIPEPKADWRDVRPEMRKKLKIADSMTVLMMAGRLHEVKGIDVALRVLAKLPKSFVLLLVGEGPKRSELEALARELGVADRVRWAGWQDSVTPYAAAADLWLAPSLHEPLGNTALDAWVHEVPLIASRTGGLEMLVEDKVTGMRVEVGDSEGLCDVIQILTEDKNLQRKIVRGARETLVRDYSEDGIVDKYVSYYRHLIKQELS